MHKLAVKKLIAMYCHSLCIENHQMYRKGQTQSFFVFILFR